MKIQQPTVPRPDLISLLKEATRAAWSELRERFPTDHFYGFALYTTEEAESVAPTAYSREGLMEVAGQYAGPHGDPTKEAEKLRFSPADSPRHLVGESHFMVIDTELTRWRNRSRARRMEAFFEALSQLDAEGLFGRGAEREALVLNVLQGDQSDRSIVENARRLNPPRVLEWFEPHFTLRENSGALFTLGARGAYQITGLALANNTLAACGSGGELYVFCRQPDGQFAEIFGSKRGGEHWACALSPDGETLYISDRNRLLARRVKGGKIGAAKVLIELHDEGSARSPEQIGCLLVSPKGDQILVWTWQHVYAVDLRGSVTWKRDAVERGLAWHPNGERIAFAEPQSVVWLDARTGSLIETIVPIEEVHALAVSPDGCMLAVGHGGGFSDGATSICECIDLVQRTRQWRTETQGLGEISSLAFSPSGKLLAAAGPGDCVHVWDGEGVHVELRSSVESFSDAVWLDEHVILTGGRDVDEGPAVTAFAVSVLTPS